MNTIDLLKTVEIFQGLDTTQLETVKDSCRITSFHEGDLISSEGSNASFLWAVIEGGVDLRFDLPGHASGKEMTITTISEGKVFGWSSFVPPFQYRLSAYCTSPQCQLIEINREGLIKVFEGNSLIGYRVMTNVAKVIGARFQQLQGELAFYEGDHLLHRKDN